MIAYAGAQRLLAGVGIELREGEVVLLSGANGSGKSTLVRCINRLIEPTAGTILFDGVDIFSLTERGQAAFRNREVGFIFQFHHLLPDFDALENVMMPGLIAGRPRPREKQRASALLTEIGLEDRLDHKPGELSGGEQQRVAVARALVCEPRIVLADEPTGNLDTTSSDDLVSLLRKFHNEKGLTSVVVTHNERIASVCDRVVYMEDGIIKERV